MNADDFRRELDAIPGFSETYQRMYPDQEVCIAVAKARARRDMTQEQFARLLGVPVKVVRKLESGNLK